MKKFVRTLLLIQCFLWVYKINYAQVGINTDGSSPAPSAILDLKSSSKGLLPPRMTTHQRDSIALPEKGLVIYNIDCGDIQFYNGSNWVPTSNSQMIVIIPEISGNHTPCLNAMGEVYSITDTSGNTNGINYHWSVPPGSTITSGQGSYSITVNFGIQSGYIYVCTYDECWKSREGAFKIALGAPLMPLQGNHTSYETSIVWKWKRVYGASGYKWNTVNDYGSAVDINSDTSETEPDLICDSIYTRYVWAYNTCTNSAASPLTTSTSICPPPCPGIPTVTYGGKTYHTVLIGSQCWMKENINIGSRIDVTSEQSNDSMFEKYCYGNDELNCDVYGGLYQWGEAVQYLNGASNSTSWNPPPAGFVKGICPSGWHIPSDAEWTNLASFLGGSDIAGGKMKEAGLVHWQSPNDGTNSSGYTGLPGGTCNPNNGFYELHQYAIFWGTAQASNPSYAYPRGMEYYWPQLVTFYSGKTSGNSVRCLKDY